MYAAIHFRLGSLVDPDARRTLLHALQADDIRAIKDGKEMLPDMWATASVRDLTSVHFRRADVLAIWPSPTDEPVSSEVPARGSPRPGGGAPRLRNTIDALRELYPPEGVPPRGQLQKVTLDCVNDKNAEKKKPKVSIETLRRALKVTHNTHK
jgi:hypothetical protein